MLALILAMMILPLAFMPTPLYAQSTIAGEPNLTRFRVFTETFESTAFKYAADNIGWETGQSALRLALRDNIVQHFPAVAANAEIAVVVWQDQRSDSGDIFAQRLDKHGNRQWKSDIRVNSDVEAGAIQSVPTVAVDSQNRIWIAWIDQRSGDPELYLQQIDPEGEKMWQTDLQVSPIASSSQQGSPTIATTPDGHLFISWHDNRSGHFDIYAQGFNHNRAQLWSEDLRLNSDGGDQNQTSPVAVVDAAGDLAVAWLDKRAGRGDIYLQRVTFDGARMWPTEVQLTTPGTITTQSPAVATANHEGDNTTVVAWTGADGTIYGQLVAASGMQLWPAKQRLNPRTQPAAPDASPALQVGTESTLQADIDSDAQSELLLVWKRFADGQLIGQPLTLSDGQPRGSARSISRENVELAPTFQRPQLVRLHDSFLTVWPDTRRDQYGDIVVQSVDVAGQPTWLREVTANESTGTVDQRTPTAVALSDSTVVIWQDWRHGYPALYCQRISAEGQPLWAMDQPLLNYPLDLNERPVADSATNGMEIAAVWADAHLGQSQVYLQQFDLDGNPFSTEPTLIQRQLFSTTLSVTATLTNSQSVTTAAPMLPAQFAPKVAMGQQGHLYLAWEERESNSRNANGANTEDAQIVLQKRDKNQQILAEVVVNSGRFPDLALNDSGALQLIWLAFAGSDVDLFTQRFDADLQALDRQNRKPSPVRVNHLEGVVDHFAPPSVELDGSGTAHIGWADRVDSGLYLQRMISGTTPFWPSNLLVNQTPGTFSMAPSLAVDDIGQTVMAWQDFQQGAYVIVTQRIDQNGDFLWQSDTLRNVVASPNAIDAQSSAVALDKGGVASIVWQDATQLNKDVALQRISSQGARLLPEAIRLPEVDRFFYPSGSVESRTVNRIEDGALPQPILAATLNSSFERAGGQVSFELTNSGGDHWAPVELGVQHVFTATGSDLRWRVRLEAAPAAPESTPEIRQIILNYEEGPESFITYLPINGVGGVNLDKTKE